MEVAVAQIAGDSAAVQSFLNPSIPSSKAALGASSDALVLQYLGDDTDDAATVSTSLSGRISSLQVSAQEILKALNQRLEAVLPEGIESLSPEDTTPEATADRIVSGIVGLFDRYLKSNPELAPDEAIERFVAAAQSGVEQGYSEAYEYLKGLGAFEFDGVESGIAETKRLIGEKLGQFRQTQLDNLSSDALVTGTAAAATLSSVLTQGGSRLSAVA